MEKTDTPPPASPIWIASDHAGFELKPHVVAAWNLAIKLNRPLIDLGTYGKESVDYPDFAQKLILSRAAVDEKNIPTPHEKIRWSEPFGILICGSGQGMAIKANRDVRVRAALSWSNEVARLARAHNDANVICIAARESAPELVYEMIQTFFSSPFEGGRHERRVAKLC